MFLIMANVYLVVTQDYIDNLVQTIASFTTDFGIQVLQLAVQQDPDAWRSEQMLMALQNIQWALRDYDIDVDLFTEQEIMYMEELATQLIQDCPLPG